MSVSRRAALMQMMLAGLVNTLLARFSTASAETATYSYDALGRVIGVTYTDGTTIAYAYDPAGNRTQMAQTGAPPPPPPPPPIAPGTVVFDSATPGAWSWTSTTTQNYDVAVWGPGGGGEPGDVGGDPKYGYYNIPGIGGGGGGYCLRQFAVTSGNQLSGRIGAGGAQSTNGSEATTLAAYQSVTLTANPGTGFGTGGTATGGATNTSGRNGGLTNYTDGGGAGNGGGDQTTQSAAGTTPGGGGAGGGDVLHGGGAGRNGRVLITAR